MPALDALCEPAPNKKKPRAQWGTGLRKGDGGFALGGNHKHSEIPKQGDSGAHKYQPLPHMPED